MSSFDISIIVTQKKKRNRERKTEEKKKTTYKYTFKIISICIFEQIKTKQ